MLDPVDGMVTSNTSFTDVVRDCKIKEYAVAKQTLFLADPDMLEVGNGGMTFAEYRAHFSIWALMKVRVCQAQQ